MTDMRTSDFQVTVDGRARRGVAVARLFRGPGAAGLAAVQQQTEAGGLPPRVEPSRLVVLVADQGSFGPGDERRAQAIAENCLGLLGLSDQLMFLRLPDLGGTQTPSADREPVRQALRLVHPLRTQYVTAADAERPENPPEPVPVNENDPTGTGGTTEEVSPARAVADLEGFLRGMDARGADVVTAPAARAHAVEMLEGLRRLLVALEPASTGATILLLSGGLVADEAGREMDAVTKAAASAFARIYPIQVPTAAPRFADPGRAGLTTLARATGGSVVTLNDKPAQALQRLGGELAFSYLLMLAPEPSDSDQRLHEISVATPRRDLTIRTSLATRPGRVVPAQAAPPVPEPSAAPAGKPSARGASGSAKPPAPRDPALDAVVARMSDYAGNYGREVSAIVSEEVYDQRVGLVLPKTRRLVSDFLMVKVPGLDIGWVPFRDVFQVDGTQVRDRDDRLRKLFLEGPVEDAIESAKKLLDEGARYNIGEVERNLNVPTLALVFAHPEFIWRFAFHKRGEPTEDGIRLWEIGFREVGRPTAIRTRQGQDIVSSGVFWVEPVSGRIVRSRLEASGAAITVHYEPCAEALGMWVPVRMEEEYSYPSINIRAIATYSKFRRFQVLTETDLKTPKTP